MGVLRYGGGGWWYEAAAVTVLVEDSQIKLERESSERHCQYMFYS